MTEDRAAGAHNVTSGDHSSPAAPSTGADGLTFEEALDRLARFGPNEIPEPRVSAVLQFLGYFWGPIPWMIEIAAVLSAVVRHWADFTIIAVLLLANAVVGFWEEFQAGNAIQALKKNLALRARVKRSGKWLEMAARELVPGDLIRLRLGDIIPADAQLKQGDPIDVDQSALTGESLPVTKKRGETVFSGSTLKRGEIDAIVMATGRRTFFGRTAELVAAAQPRSHFQQAVLTIGNYLIVLALALAVAIVVVSIVRGEPGLTTVRFALVLTVAAIPVAMPTVLSVTMAVGARRLAGRQAVVRKLPAVEEMAGIDVLCADKTGTLTQNKLTLGEPFTVANIGVDEVILAAALASREEDQDPIDLAVLQGVKDPQQLRHYRITHFFPFDPVHKRTEADVIPPDGKAFKVTKGAPQVILALSSDREQLAQAANQVIENFATRGFRSLGVARNDGDRWRFLGILPLFDPPREDSAPTIQAAKEMGLEVKMVTGDQVAIAREVAGSIGLGRNIMDAQVFGNGQEGAAQPQTAEQNAALEKAVQEADGFAQVFPEHKYRIVKLLQAKGHIVGMTGDGVNDAPALKQADAGIAVSGSTDAARAAASIVLMSPGLSIIVDAIKQSREIFQRMNSYAIYRITETLRVLFFVAAVILVVNFYPVTAIMIVLLAILNDGAILSIAFDRARWGNKPEVWEMSTVLALATTLGLMGVAETFGLFYLSDRVFELDRLFLQSLIYLKLSVSGHLTIFVTRTRRAFWSHRPSWILLIAVVGTQFLATFIVVGGFLMKPIGWSWAGFVWGYALVMFLLEDRVKLLVYRVQNVYRRRRKLPL